MLPFQLKHPRVSIGHDRYVATFRTRASRPRQPMVGYRPRCEDAEAENVTACTFAFVLVSE